MYWVGVRPQEVGLHWEEHGTWLRPPLLIDRRFLDPSSSGLQVVEGRTRVGVLRGRVRERRHVAPDHQAWRLDMLAQQPAQSPKGGVQG
ncbi:hypothetical protein [Streptomyces recifensis]|uniref:hypothetical protein n=1 Tax=Streptomyces recifensis TaxID=67355 RepID=UPI001FC8F98B|nr:hypothetical protein [Streptomyces recifensis]